MKNFYECHNFSGHVIDVYIITLLIKTTSHEDVNEFKVWVVEFKWFCLIEKVQKLYYKSFYIQFFGVKNKKKAKLAVDTAQIRKKEK